MSDETGLMNRPKKIWNEALKRVKGEDTTQLIEQFTAEMTLVAEGLCEDQNKLRGEVNRMVTEEDRRLQQLNSRVEELDRVLTDQEREHDSVITELRGRLAVLERQNERFTREAERKEKKSRNSIRDITILIVVAAAAVIAVSLVLKLT